MIELPNVRQDIEGCADKIEGQTSEDIKWMASHFYIRNGVRHEDGSMGTVRMTPGDLRNLIAYAILQERARSAVEDK